MNTTQIRSGSWQCTCLVDGLRVTHTTGTYCGKCGQYAPGCGPAPVKDVRDVELASLRSAFKAQRATIDELRGMLDKLFRNGYRIKGSFLEMLDNPEFRKALAGGTFDE